MTQRITPVGVGWIPAVGLMMAGCQAPASPPPSVPVMNDSEVVFPIANRPDVRGTLGAVSSDHPLASAVGLEILRDGGTSIDAVVGMAAVLAVVRPHMNGVGGDAFAIFYDGATGRVTGMNGSGLRQRPTLMPAVHLRVGPGNVGERILRKPMGTAAPVAKTHQRFAVAVSGRCRHTELGLFDEPPFDWTG